MQGDQTTSEQEPPTQVVSDEAIPITSLFVVAYRSDYNILPFLSSETLLGRPKVTLVLLFKELYLLKHNSIQG